MTERAPKDLFLESLDRCTASETFIPAFYERFLNSSDEVKNKFRFTDFDKQYQMLERSLRLIAGATAGEAASLKELRERAKSHDQYHLNVRPGLYEFWKSTVMETAAEFDPEWSQLVRDAWEKILDLAISHMVKHY